jgi:hypothetical protein
MKQFVLCDCLLEDHGPVEGIIVNGSSKSLSRIQILNFCLVEIIA